MKRGVEMSLQTIVVAVVLLLIAAILIILVGTNLGVFNNAVSDCTSKGGECADSCRPGTFPGGVCPDDEVCCVTRDGMFGGS